MYIHHGVWLLFCIALSPFVAHIAIASKSDKEQQLNKVKKEASKELKQKNARESKSDNLTGCN